MGIINYSEQQNLYKPLIKNRATQFTLFSRGSDKADNQKLVEPIYSEQVLLRGTDESDSSFDSILVDISLTPEWKQEDEDIEFSCSPYALIFSISFDLYKSASLDDELSKTAINEAVIRARIATADFVYFSGGEMARKFFIEKQHSALGIDG